MRDPQPAQLEHVAEAGGRDERGRAAAPLEHGVRRHRRAVDDLGDAAGPLRARRPPRRPLGRSSAASRAACGRRRGPSAPWRITSVKVPPTSTPTRASAAHSGRSSRSARCWPWLSATRISSSASRIALRPGLDRRPVGGGDDEDRVAVGDHLVARRDLDAADRHGLADREHLLLHAARRREAAVEDREAERRDRAAVPDRARRSRDPGCRGTPRPSRRGRRSDRNPCVRRRRRRGSSPREPARAAGAPPGCRRARRRTSPPGRRAQPCR